MFKKQLSEFFDKNDKFNKSIRYFENAKEVVKIINDIKKSSTNNTKYFI